MFTKEQQYILFLIRKSITPSTKPEAFDGINFDVVKELILMNGILATVYGVLPEPLHSQLNTKYLAIIAKLYQQSYEERKIINKLSQYGLDCMALKGWEIRNLYPQVTMREMVDFDILIRPYRFDAVKNALYELGFNTSGTSSWKHDEFRRSNILVETHKRLTDDNRKIKNWEQSMWSRSIEEREHIYRMSPEDIYIFHFIHLYKDFCNGSLGLRRIIDTWLLCNKMKRDIELTERELTGLGLQTFHNRIVALSSSCIDNLAFDHDSEVMLLHAFKYGIYGTDKSYKSGRVVQYSRKKGLNSGKLRSMRAAVFLPVERMKTHFPILDKYPFLLPYYWMKRICHYAYGENAKWSRIKLDYSEIKEEDYREMAEFFAAGGL